ncbi:hypothetical protein HanHA300_Chr08g0275491 [Helianthus annuus]|nr:hypothetical protein HanHA300_Chr08g0275491 [Helianthus annuus]KAJ0722028.1 hypothetical protein HanOQP8_Chr08g0282101 [Helianthus annuus]
MLFFEFCIEYSYHLTWYQSNCALVVDRLWFPLVSVHRNSCRLQICCDLFFVDGTSCILD